jgi:hypothetical protein
MVDHRGPIAILFSLFSSHTSGCGYALCMEGFTHYLWEFSVMR